MPILSSFYGMIIGIYHDDHPPPHFHVEYAEKEAWVEIGSGKVIHGDLSLRLLKDVQKWRRLHKDELMIAWNDAQNHKTPKK